MKKTLTAAVVIAFSLIAVCSRSVRAGESIYDFTMKDINGETVALSSFKGKEVLIVNTASKCGFTPQYKSLEALYEKYKDQGLVILGFPANNFKNQEPGTNDDIKSFCLLNYSIKFPMFSKISVAGEDMDPLYQYLTAKSGFDGPITWNFNKFLVNSEGKVIARFDTKTDPLDPAVLETVEKNLPKKLETE